MGTAYEKGIGSVVTNGVRSERVEITDAEKNYLSGVTAGTRAAGKAVVVDASGTVDALDVTTLTSSGSAVVGVVDGTAFPGSPTTGDRFRRTDIDYEIFFYDGTRWLSEQLRSFTMVMKANATAADGLTGNDFGLIPTPDDYQVYLTKWNIALYSNDASAVFGFALSKKAHDNTSTLLDDQTITIDAANEYINRTTALGDVVDGTQGETTAANEAALSVDVDEDTTGNIDWGAVTIEYRIIAT